MHTAMIHLMTVRPLKLSKSMKLQVNPGQGYDRPLAVIFKFAFWQSGPSTGPLARIVFWSFPDRCNPLHPHFTINSWGRASHVKSMPLHKWWRNSLACSAILGQECSHWWAEQRWGDRWSSLYWAMFLSRPELGVDAEYSIIRTTIVGDHSWTTRSVTSCIGARAVKSSPDYTGRSVVTFTHSVYLDLGLFLFVFGIFFRFF